MSGLSLPPKVPLQAFRPVQSNIPARRVDRDRLARAAAARVRDLHLAPPLSFEELREHATALLTEHALPDAWLDYAAVLISNASWHDVLAAIPFERRVLLLPKCLRVAARCPAPFDGLGLLCKSCGLCSLDELTAEAERLGYAVLVAEGSAVVRKLVETGIVDAVVGVACLNVLERSFPHLEQGAVPGLAIPLLQDDCLDTTVDLDQVWSILHLTSDDRSHRLDLDALRDEVAGWFDDPTLDRLLGPATSAADHLAREALAGGKRWRPFLGVCAWQAVRADAGDDRPIDDDVRRVAVALECFHKASLVHDDVEDEDALRDDLPTLHARHGAAPAINAGDLLVGWGYRLLAGLTAPPATTVSVLRAAAEGHAALCRGQGTELADRGRADPPPPMEVLDTFRLKTAPAFGVALEAGARLAGADDDVLAVLAAFSDSLGIAYQLHDDLADLDRADASGRGSVLVSLAFRKAADPAPLRAAWHGDLPLRDVRPTLQAAGAVTKANELAKAWEEQAVRSLRQLHEPTLKGLLRRVVARILPQELPDGSCASVR